MSTRYLPGGEGRPARKIDNLTAICEPNVYKMWEPRRFTTLRPLTRMAILTLLFTLLEFFDRGGPCFLHVTSKVK
jgi:hypothetical protein